MAAVSVDAAVTLLGKIIDLVARGAQRRRIEQQDFDQLQSKLRELNSQMEAYSDTEKLFFTLTQAEIARSHAAQVKSLVAWMDENYSHWTSSTKRKSKLVDELIWAFLRYLLTDIKDHKIENNLGQMALMILPITYRDSYRPSVTGASQQADRAIIAADWERTKSETNSLSVELSQMVSVIEADLDRRTRLLMGRGVTSDSNV